MVTAFSNAALETGGWGKALQTLASGTGAGRAQLIGFGSAGGLHFSHVSDVETILDEDVAAGVADPSESWRLASSRGVLEIISETDYARTRPRMLSGAYDEYCNRWDIPFGSQTILLATETLSVGIATLRGQRDGVSTEDQLALFRAAMPAAQASVRMQRALDSQGAELALGGIDALGSAVFMLDGVGRVMAMSHVAAEALGLGLVRVVHHHLATTTGETDRWLQQAIRKALASNLASPSRRWLPSHLERHSGATCEVFSLARREWDMGFRPSVMVVLKVPTPLAAETAAELRQVFGLTQAEAQVALQIANGTSREDVAERRNTSRGTVSIQIKTILMKLGVRREGEAIAIMNQVLRPGGWRYDERSPASG